MFRYCLLVAVVYAAVELAQADDSSDKLNFKLTQMSAGMVLRMTDKLKIKMLDFAKKMQEDCKYMKAMYEYGFTCQADQAIGGHCSSDKDIEVLQNNAEQLKEAFTTCFDGLNVMSSIDTFKKETVTKIQDIDKTAKETVDACSGDKTCEFEAYRSLKDSMNNLYTNKTAEARLIEDEAMAHGLSEMVKCIMLKVADSYVAMVKATSKIQSCLALGPSKTEEANTEDTEAEENKIEDTEAEETETENTEAEETKTEYTEAEETKTENGEAEETKTE